MYLATVINNALLKDRASSLAGYTLATLITLLSTSSLTYARTADEFIDSMFWGQLHSEGGKSYYCKTE